MKHGLIFHRNEQTTGTRIPRWLSENHLFSCNPTIDFEDVEAQKLGGEVLRL